MDLDSADWAIVRALLAWQGDVFPSAPLRVPHRELGRITGLHANTIATRLRALEDAGVLEGAFLDPNPGAVSAVRAWHEYSGVPSPVVAAASEALAPFLSITMIVGCHDLVLVDAWHAPGEVERDAARIGRAFGATVHRTVFHSGELPDSLRPTGALTPLDGRILVATRRSPRSTPAQIGKDLGVSARTVERRMQRMVAERLVSVRPVWRPGRVEGGLVVAFDVPDPAPGTHAALARAFPDRILGPFGPNSRTQGVHAPFRSLEGAHARLAEAGSEPSLQGLRMHLVRDIAYPAAFAEWLAAHVGIPQPDVG